MNLQLSLKRKWFDLTKKGIKPEDYREITPFWCNRLLLYENKPMSIEWWYLMKNYEGYSFEKAITHNIEKGKLSFKDFDFNIMTLGYPKKNDSEQIIKLKHKGIEIKEGRPEWGAEPNKLYFVIKHEPISEYRERKAQEDFAKDIDYINNLLNKKYYG